MSDDFSNDQDFIKNTGGTGQRRIQYLYPIFSDLSEFNQYSFLLLDEGYLTYMSNILICFFIENIESSQVYLLKQVIDYANQKILFYESLIA